ncbi:FhaA domain-containing protein [Slackia heliotrinireducens]
MEDTFEGTANKISNAPISPVQIVKKAEKQMRRERVVSAGKEYAPTLYTVLVNADDDQRLFGFYPTLAGETETRLAATASDEGLFMDGQPLVRFIVDENLKHGKFDVIAEVVSAPIIEELRKEEMQRYGMAASEQSVVSAQPVAMPDPQPVVAQSPVQVRPGLDLPDIFGADPEPVAAVPAFAQQPFGYQQDAYGMQNGAYPQTANDMAYPQASDYQPVEEVKPPLPYVPEEEIDRSIDYGEYTFDSHNFTDYNAPQEPEAEEQPAQNAAHPVTSNPLVASGTALPDLPSTAPDNDTYAAQGQVFGAPAAQVQAPQQYQQPQYQQQYGYQQPYQQPYGYQQPAQQYNPYAPATSAFVGGQQQVGYPPAQRAAVARLIDTASNRAYALATQRVLVGRETSNDIVVNDLNTSRHHAEIHFEPQGVWVITDLGSTNGTYVNGQPVSRRGLQEGDRITLGATDFIFTLR